MTVASQFCDALGSEDFADEVDEDSNGIEDKQRRHCCAGAISQTLDTNREQNDDSSGENTSSQHTYQP
jgi:hypothetical protein